MSFVHRTLFFLLLVSLFATVCNLSPFIAAATPAAETFSCCAPAVPVENSASPSPDCSALDCFCSACLVIETFSCLPYLSVQFLAVNSPHSDPVFFPSGFRRAIEFPPEVC